jgi:hypothetical protein
MRKSATTAYRTLALVFAACVVLQVFFAGLGIFGAESFKTHETFGFILHAATIVLLLLAIAGPRNRHDVGLAFGLLVLTTVQITLVGSRDDTPGLAALHPVLALGVLALALYMGRGAVRKRMVFRP